VTEEPFEAFWGGGFSWRDPEGNICDVAWAKGATIEARISSYLHSGATNTVQLTPDGKPGASAIVTLN
jgi:hypothetical protein